MAHTYRGQRTPVRRQSKRFSQASNRRSIVLYDQTVVPKGFASAGADAERKWSASIELRSGAPTGLISNDFSAPFLPDQKYLKVNPDNVTELFIDYAQMFNDRRRSNQDHHAKVRRWCRRKGVSIPKMGDYNEDIEEACGRAPLPVEPVVAAFQGNPWVLGLCVGCGKASCSCICPQGYRPHPPDPRLVRFFERRVEELPDETKMDLGIESYEAVAGESLEEARQRPSQFRERGLTEAEDDSEADRLPPGLRSPLAEDARVDVPPASADDQASYDAALEELELKADKGQVGGKTVPPKAADRAAKQAPRPVGQTTRRKRGAHASAKGAAKAVRSSRRRAPSDSRPSLADGAVPVVAD